MLDRNGKGRSVQKYIVEQRQQQQDAGVRVPGPETIDLKRRKRVAAIQESQQRIPTEHHSRQRNPGKNYPNSQTSHNEFLLLCDACNSTMKLTDASGKYDKPE